MSDSKLAAIHNSRRSFAVAIFVGTHLDYVQVHHLSSSHKKAEDSTVGFVRWIVAKFEVSLAALEQFSEDNGSRSAVLNRVILKTFREAGVSIWLVSKPQLFQAYAIPPIRSRKELRAIASSFWPVLTSKGGDGQCLHAAMLGLYVETERLLLT
jgi:hypothetical protein